MELVPIITQILGIVAAVFIIVLIVSFTASKLRKKEQPDSSQMSSYNNSQALNFVGGINTANKSQYYGANYYSNTNSFQKEIKVVKRSSIPKGYSTSVPKKSPTNSNSRFTVLNSIAFNDNRPIETDEYGFKIYSNNEITRSVYLQN